MPTSAVDDDFFSPEETKRRMDEVFSRMFRHSPTMNMRTGQNLKEPFLSEQELIRRGYPCQEDFGDGC